MPACDRISRARRLGAGVTLALAASAAAGPVPPALRGVNPDQLSGGLFQALESQGVFGLGPGPARAAAAADLAKGRAPLVLDPRVGANLRLGDDPAVLPEAQRGQAEAHLYRSAATPAVLLAVFQDGRFSVDGGAIGIGYGVTRDGGLTWSRALLPRLTRADGGPFQRATDPVAAIGPNGDFYVNALGAINGDFSLGAVVVCRSTDQGATWSAPIRIYESPNAQIMPDKNWLAVNDTPGSPNAGRLVATWTNFTSSATGAALGNNILAAISDDRGGTWSAPVAVTPPGASNQGSQPVFLPDGSLALVYITFANTNSVTAFSIQCVHSPDGGRTFPTAAVTAVGVVNGWDDPEVRDGVFLPAATAARQTGELFICYVGLVAGTPRVLVTRSADRGATWTTPVVASDQPAGISVMNPGIAVSPDGRTVSVVFMDKRHAPGGRGLVDHTLARSFDGGATWEPNLRLSDLSSDLRFGPQTSRGVMLGDYLGVAAPAGPGQAGVAIWCDTRSGDADPCTVRFAPGTTSDGEGWLVARGLGPPLEDADRDGVSNELEFYSGTDPRIPDYGEDVLTYRLADGQLAVAVTGRPGLNAGTEIALRLLPSGLAFTGGSAPLAPNELPATPAPGGLVWSGRKFAVPDRQAVEVLRGRFIVRGTQEAPVLQVQSLSGIGTFAATDGRLVNLATRGLVRSPASPLIVGFVLDGAKSILVRAAGPALAALGVAEVLPDPRIAFSISGGAPSPANDNWQQGGAALATQFGRVGAFPFAPASLDAAAQLELPAQAHTAIISGADNTAGVVLAEAYDADVSPGAADRPRILNLSSRGEAGAGSRALIGGFTLGGTLPRRVLVRAVGPGLARLGVTGALTDPMLAVYRGGTLVAANDDWELARGSAASAAAAQRLGAFALPAASLDAALLLTLAPGAYTVVVTSATGETGLALVEIYDAD